VASKVLLELLDGIFNERFLKHKKTLTKIKNVKKRKKRDKNKKRKKRFLHLPKTLR